MHESLDEFKFRPRTSSKFGQIGLRTAELAALGRLEKSP